MKLLPFVAMALAGGQDLDPAPGVGPKSPAEVQQVLDRRDPARDGAVFETIARKLHDWLVPLERALVSGVSDEAMAGVQVAEEFLTTPLRPAKVQTIEVGSDRVLERSLGRPPQPELEGLPGLMGALREVRRPYEDDVPLDRIATKVVYAGRGEEGEDSWIALVRAQLAQDRPEEAREMVAQWIVKMTWSLDETRKDSGALNSGEILVQELSLSSFQEIVRRPGGPLYVDATEGVLGGLPAFEDQLQYGLDDWCERVDARLGLSLLGHEGLALGDVNGDDRDDLYVLEPGGLPNRLLLTKAAGGFEDASAAAGVDFLDPSRSALFVDLDGDGDQDLAAVIAGDLLLFSNDELGEEEAGVRFRLRARLPAPSFFSLSAADIENDGDLDLYACAYALPYAEESTPIPYHDANNGSPNVLYRNDGGWRFTDATGEVGLDEANRRFSFAAAWEDYDLDGDQDLYVANDFGRNALYRNDLEETGRFTEVAAAARVEDISAGMGVDWADVDGDGIPDVHVSNMFSSAGGRVAFQPEFLEGAPEPVIAAFRRHARGNALFRGSEDGVFRDVSRSSGISMGRWAWGALFLDFENDGAPDLYVPNGYVTGAEDSGDL